MNARKVAAVADAVRSRGGIVRSTELQRAGISKHDIAEAVRAGVIARERRIWLVAAEVDALLLLAARVGAVLSCVTQAARLGLWAVAVSGAHLAGHPHAGAKAVQDAVIHRFAPLVARAPGVLFDPIENVLCAVAQCRPFEDALAVWDSALNKGLVTLSQLDSLPLHGQARELRAAATPFADSGLETFVRVRLRWLRLPIRWQTWVLGHPVDFLIGQRLVLQIDGGHHVGAQRTSDIAHDAQLMLAGYHVIRVGYEQVMYRWEEVQDVIMAAIARGLHLAR